MQTIFMASLALSRRIHPFFRFASLHFANQLVCTFRFSLRSAKFKQTNFLLRKKAVYIINHYANVLNAQEIKEAIAIFRCLHPKKGSANYFQTYNAPRKSKAFSLTINKPF